jgi:sugar lactone lactonase YvrE
VTTGYRVRRVDHATGVISTVGGNGEWRFGGDGLPASEATFYYPAAAAAVAGGGFVIADRDNQRVRRIDGGTGLVSTIAGPTAPLCESVASFFYGSLCPVAVAADGAGNVFAADAAAYHIRKIAAGTGLVTTIAGNGSPGASGDGGPATAASIGQPFGLAVDGGGNLFFADFAFHCVRRIDHATGVITTVVGTGQPGYAGDGGPARAATLASPAGVAFDGRGNLYIADHDNNRVRRVDPAGVITTVAGNGTQGATGDGGPATAAALSLPISVAADASGNLAIADQGNNKVRRVDAGNGVITTLAGTGDVGLYGMGGPATSAVISAPRGVLLDAAGELFVVDQLHHRLLRVGPETTPRAFFTVPPCRIADTREPAGAQGGPSLTPSADRVFGVGGRCQVPSSAKAVSLNVTVTGPGGSGDLRLYPGGGFVPQASAINYAAGQTRANSAVLALGLSGNVAVKVDQGVGAVDVILDVNGYFE